MEEVYNYNVGVLGHIDSGKTSIVRVLSEVLSTAALDKHPQSAERKITLDLGFSAFRMPMPEKFGPGTLQITLVDCPGHASLIRTVIAGASIIDKMLLVIDATKGVQTQTAECIVIAELLIKGLLVVAINKVDLVEEKKLEALEKKLRALFMKTRFKDKVAFVKVAAAPRSGDPIGAENLKSTLVDSIEELPDREVNEALYYAVDHCFPVKGQGTVMTGTILQGSLKVGDTIEVLQLNVTKKIKSMQSFHKPISYAKKGDRVAVCVTQFDSKLIERGIVSRPNTLRLVSSCIIKVNPIQYYTYPIKTNSKHHITCGNETVMGSCVFFSCANEESKSGEPFAHNFEPDLVYSYEETISLNQPKNYFALMTLDSPVCTLQGGVLIGSKLDLDTTTKKCRIAFAGVVEVIEPEVNCTYLKVSKPKERKGEVERIQDPYTAICKGMFHKESDLTKFQGLKVEVAGAIAYIQSSFGKSGKFKINFPEGNACMGEVVLRFKKLLWDNYHRLIQ